MGYFCHKCTTQLTAIERGKVGRSESCPKCASDLHVCLNCKHYDKTAYNECRETQAERVLNKDRSNFCDFFSFVDRNSAASQSSGAKDPFKDLDALFKK